MPDASTPFSPHPSVGRHAASSHNRMGWSEPPRQLRKTAPIKAALSSGHPTGSTRAIHTDSGGNLQHRQRLAAHKFTADRSSGPDEHAGPAVGLVPRNIHRLVRRPIHSMHEKVVRRGDLARTRHAQKGLPQSGAVSLDPGAAVTAMGIASRKCDPSHTMPPLLRAMLPRILMKHS